MKKVISIFFLMITLVNADLSKTELRDLKKLISFEESKDNYKAKNSRAFLGKYQFGAAALVDTKLVHRNKYKNATFIKQVGKKSKLIWKNGLTHAKFLFDPKNWILKGGEKTFLNTPSIQEAAMDKLLQINYKRILDSGVNPKDKQTIKGLLIASHLGGVKNALNYSKNKIEFKDAFGTKISKYYKIGSAASGKDIEILAKKYLGGKYTWGGTNPNKGMDCSGYTQFIFKKIGINLPRTALQQYKWSGGSKIDNKLKKGDLLFFNTDPKRGLAVSHVGVYLEDNKFIHSASSKKGIIISSLDGIYKKTFVGAKRVFMDSTADTVLYAAVNKSKPLAFTKKFFEPTLENALIARTKIAFNFDPLVVHNGVYMRQSQVNN